MRNEGGVQVIKLVLATAFVLPLSAAPQEPPHPAPRVAEAFACDTVALRSVPIELESTVAGDTLVLASRVNPNFDVSRQFFWIGFRPGVTPTDICAFLASHRGSVVGALSL